MKIRLILPCILLSTVLCFGQQTNTDTTRIVTDKVEVLKQYEASILQAQRKSVVPQKKVTSYPDIRYNYNVTTEKVIDFERPDPEIRALKFQPQQEEQKDIKEGYVYAAYGNYKTKAFGAAYHYYIEDWLEGGLSYDHFSAIDSLNNYARNKAKLYVGYFLSEKTKLRLDLQGDFFRQGLSSMFPDAITLIPINKYKSELELAHFNFEDKGIALRLGGGIEYSKVDLLRSYNDQTLFTSFNAIKTFSDKLSIELPVKFNSVSTNIVTDSLARENGSDLHLSPVIRFNESHYSLKAGIEYIIAKSFNESDDASFLFPLIELELPNIINRLDLSFYTESDYFRNSQYQHSIANPILDFSNLRYTPYYHRSYKVKANYDISDFDFGLTVGYNQYNNEINFIDQSENYVTSEELDRNELALMPSALFNPTKNIELDLRLRYNVFLTDSLNLYYKPKFLGELSAAEYLFDERLELKQTLVYNHSRYVYNHDSPTLKSSLDPFIDLSLQLKFRISESFDVFAKGTNILGKAYRINNGLNVYTTQLWAGLKFRI